MVVGSTFVCAHSRRLRFLDRLYVRYWNGVILGLRKGHLERCGYSMVRCDLLRCSKNTSVTNYFLRAGIIYSHLGDGVPLNPIVGYPQSAFIYGASIGLLLRKIIEFVCEESRR
jgi:hypothetical protein